MNALVEGARRAAQPIQCQSADHVRGIHQPLNGFQFQTADGQHGLRAIDQADAFFGMQRDGLDSRAAERFGAIEQLAFELGFAFADQHEGYMRERSQVPGCADASLRRHHRGDAAVEQIAQPLRHQRTNPREAHRQHVGADQDHGAHHLPVERRTDAHAMGTDHVALELFELVARDADVSQQAHAGIHRVDGVLSGG